MSLASLEPSRPRRRAWELDRDLVAELAGSPRASLAGRLLARYELSLAGIVPPWTSLMLIAPTWPVIVVGIGEHHVPLLKIMLGWIALGLVAMVLEMGRSAWVSYHPFASRRWLHAVARVAGPEMITAVLRHLAVYHRNDSDYAIRRSDVTIWLRGERYRRREAAKRARGVRLAHDLPPA